jgi:hypothetical protein
MRVTGRIAIPDSDDRLWTGLQRCSTANALHSRRVTPPLQLGKHAIVFRAAERQLLTEELRAIHSPHPLTLTPRFTIRRSRSPPRFARCATFAKVVMGGRRYGRTVGTTIAPARSAAAAVTMLIAPCWTPVPGPKSISMIAVVPTNATATAIAAGTSSLDLGLFSICIHLSESYILTRPAFPPDNPLADKIRVKSR